MGGSVYSYTTGSSKRKWGFCVDLGSLRWDEEKQRMVRPQLRRAGFERKLDAERALEEELPAIRMSTAPSLADRQLTVGQWANRWLESKVSIRPATLAGYRQITETYVKPGIGHLPLMQLRPDHLDHLFALIRSGQLRPKRDKRRSDGRLAASTVRQIHAVATVMLGAAVKRRLIQYNPMTGVEVEQPEHRHDVTWSVAEADAFLAFAAEQEPRLAIAFRIALSYGLRRGELAGLRWQDVEEGWLHVRQNMAAVGELVPGQPKTRAGRRSIAEPRSGVHGSATRAPQAPAR